jgi:hypothetical protein
VPPPSIAASATRRLCEEQLTSCEVSLMAKQTTTTKGKGKKHTTPCVIPFENFFLVMSSGPEVFKQEDGEFVVDEQEDPEIFLDLTRKETHLEQETDEHTSQLIEEIFTDYSRIDEVEMKEREKMLNVLKDQLLEVYQNLDSFEKTGKIKQGETCMCY